MSTLGTAFYEFAYWVTALALTFGFRLRVWGARNIPPRGPVLFIANHQSFLDPPAIGVAVNRHISYLARKTLFKQPLFGALLRALNSVPIDQEGVGKEGIRAILERLEAGDGVLVFPEGERCWDGDMSRLKPGIALLLKRVQVPIVPIGIAGAFDAWPRTDKLPKFAPLLAAGAGHPLTVSIGPPRDPKTYAHLGRDELLAMLHGDIEMQWRRAQSLRARR